MIIISMSDHNLPFSAFWPEGFITSLPVIENVLIYFSQHGPLLSSVMTDWQHRAVEKIVHRQSQFICILIFICCYCCCDLYKSRNLKDTDRQSANEDPNSILATYPKSAGGPILCAEAPVTIMHPGLSYLSRSSNMVQALRIPA